MDDLLELIDEFGPGIEQAFLDAIDITKDELEAYLLENYPADDERIDPDSDLDVFIESAVAAQLLEDFTDKIAALHNQAAIPLILLLTIPAINIQKFKTDFIEVEIRVISSQAKYSFKTFARTKKQAIESLGLSPNQARSLQAYRQELERIAKDKVQTISTNVIRNLSASQRAAVRAAIIKGIEAEDVDTLVAKQHKAMLHARAKAIGNNLASKAAHAAQQAVIDTAINLRLINPSEYKRYWITAHDEKVRHAHTLTEAMNAKGVSLQQPFQTPLGPTMNPPLEINCRCHVSIKKMKQ